MNSNAFSDDEFEIPRDASESLSEEATATFERNYLAELELIRHPWNPHLTHRLRVLLHTKPLLDLRLGDAHCAPALRHYDSLSLALKVFDLIIETTGLDREIDSETAIRALIPLMVQMDRAEGIEPDLSRHTLMAERLLAALRNDAKSRHPFEVDYTDFEVDCAIRRTLEFKLIYDYNHPDGRIVLRLSNEAINLFLNALKLDIEDAQAAAEAVVQSQLERGRFNEAVNSARDARLQSIRFQEKIEQVLRETRRDISRVDWWNKVPRLLSDALQHIDTRCRVEKNIAGSAREKLDYLVLGSNEAQQVATVVQLVEDCLQRHVELHGRLMQARGVFLEEQERQSFAPRPAADLPNFITDVLEPLLKARRAEVERLLEDAFPVFFGARSPQTFSLTQLIAWQLQPRREVRPSEIPLESRDLLIVERDHLRYPEEIRPRAASYFEQIEQPTKLSELLERASEADEPIPILEMIALIAFRLFGPDDEESLKLTAEKVAGGRFVTLSLSGDDLLLSQRNSQ